MNIVHIVHGKANPAGHNGISRVVYYLNKNEKALGENSQIWAVVDGQVKHEKLIRDPYVSVEMFPRVTFLNKNNKESICTYIRNNKHRIDIIHFHMIWFYDKNIIASLLMELDIPFIITTHGTYSIAHAYTGKRKIARFLYEKKYLNMATEIHALQHGETYGNYKYGVKVPQFIIPNGIETSEILVKNQNVNKDKVILFWIGVFRKDKNLEQLIRAIAYLPEEIKAAIKLIMAGPDNKGNKDALKRLVKANKLSEIIEIKDAVYNEEKYKLIAASDVCIMPSESEGFSMAVLDAIASGKPCILTKQCGLEYYYNENFFFMCEPYYEDIARAIEELFRKRDQLSLMGENARKLTESLFSWNVIAKKMIENYRRILGEK